MPRRRRPAPGQLTFGFLVLVDEEPAGLGVGAPDTAVMVQGCIPADLEPVREGGGAPDTIMVQDVAVRPSRTCQECVPGTRSVDRPSWRPRRNRGETRPSSDRRDRIVDRWIRRGASCLLCGHWPAPHDRLVRGRLVLVCDACERRPDTGTRLDEVVREDWRQTVEN